MFELIPKGFYYDFVGQRRFAAGISFLASFIGIVLFFTMGPRWSIDFTGGTEVEFHFQQETSIQEVREALAVDGIAEDQVQQLGSESRFVVRVQSEEASAARPEDIEAVKAALAAKFGPAWVAEFKVDAEVGSRAAVTYTGERVDVGTIQEALKAIDGVAVQGSQEENTVYVRLPGLAEEIHKTVAATLGSRGVEMDRSDAVGPKVGSSLRTAGLTSIVVSMVLLLVYIGIRFDFTFAPGAILCLFHDTTITVGVFVLFRQEFGLSMISALLTLIGYSINDTIVVYDRIRENMHKYRKKDFGDLINDSVNQTLSRTVMTSAATCLAMVPFLFLGGPVLAQFAKCMLFGIAIGTYSSIYVAAPLTMLLHEYSEPIKNAFGLKSKPKSEDAVTPGGKKARPWEKAKAADKAP